MKQLFQNTQFVYRTGIFFTPNDIIFTEFMHIIDLNQIDLTKVSELTAPHLFIYSFA